MSGPTYSLGSYRALLVALLAAGRRFAGFLEEAPDATLLRHDVDYSVEMAVELAEVNASLGVRGTFFLLPRGDTYNLVSHHNLALARRLHALGQRLAVHVAAPLEALEEAPADGERLLADAVRRDHDLVRADLPMVEPLFSWHNPTPELLARDRARPGLAGLVSAYGARYAPLVYLSDSNLRHRPEALLSSVQAARGGVQLLLHPFNWVAGGDSMLDVLQGTWRRLLLEREPDLRRNRVHGAAFPEGLPPAVVDAFTGAWRAAADAR